jgi:hypothetical protein
VQFIECVVTNQRRDGHAGDGHGRDNGDDNHRYGLSRRVSTGSDADGVDRDVTGLGMAAAESEAPAKSGRAVDRAGLSVRDGMRGEQLENDHNYHYDHDNRDSGRDIHGDGHCDRWQREPGYGLDCYCSIERGAVKHEPVPLSTYCVAIGWRMGDLRHAFQLMYTWTA